jgi:hypothetical protein
MKLTEVWLRKNLTWVKIQPQVSEKTPPILEYDGWLVAVFH